ncbi:MAG: 4Fe-4S binding protein [Propionivibrio sp.]|nr:4Fe-4S binding protein [Propionivibrio sp.]
MHLDRKTLTATSTPCCLGSHRSIHAHRNPSRQIPHITAAKCINCSKCSDVCPFGAISMIQRPIPGHSWLSAAGPVLKSVRTHCCPSTNSLQQHHAACWR